MHLKHLIFIFCNTILGAMENWGLITFREISILCDPVLTSSRAKEMITHIVVHEVGHFWFGNLTTMVSRFYI